MKPGLQLNVFKKILWVDQRPEGDNYYYLLNNSVALVGSASLNLTTKVLFDLRRNFYLGSKLYYMNKDGGLSYFDVTNGDTIESLDNTTFVSTESTVMPWSYFPSHLTQFTTPRSSCLHSPVKTNMNNLPGKIFMKMIKLLPSNKGWHWHHVPHTFSEETELCELVNLRGRKLCDDPPRQGPSKH